AAPMSPRSPSPGRSGEGAPTGPRRAGLRCPWLDTGPARRSPSGATPRPRRRSSCSRPHPRPAGQFWPAAPDPPAPWTSGSDAAVPHGHPHEATTRAQDDSPCPDRPKHRSVKQLTTRSTEVVDVDVEELKLVHAAASLACTGIGGLSSRFRVFVRMVIGSFSRGAVRPPEWWQVWACIRTGGRD